MTALLIPSEAALLKALWDYLKLAAQSRFKSEVVELHPNKATRIPEDKFYIVMSLVSDRLEGSVITRKALIPRIQFACWANTYILCQTAKEILRLDLENFCHINANPTMKNIGQSVSCVRKLGAIGPNKDSETNLYYCALDAEFFLSIGDNE